MKVTEEEFRRAAGRFATGVTVVTIPKRDGEVHGMTANAFSSVSLDPLLVLVCIDHRAQTLPLLQAQGCFGVNVLSEDQRAAADFYAQAEKNDAEAERFGIRFRFTENGTPVLEGCLAHLDCRVVSTVEAGDHTIFIGEVQGVAARDGQPLLFFGGEYCTVGP